MNRQLHPVMLAGTGSDVGKSVLATALCRIFMQDGYHPAPFKAQNMALNSFATPEGLEIGRAQAVQAEAAGIPCHSDMNPLLLKPQSDHTSQVVLNGRPLGNRDAYDFWRHPERAGKAGDRQIDFRAEVCAAFDRLNSRFNPIVMEGAGSIAELNLRERDLVNMPMARHADARVILVGDIDRGGIFASVYGSIALQTPEDRARIRGIIVNKFRGDLRLFDEGRHMLEDICGVPVLGVVPYFRDIHIEEEDSVDLQQKARHADGGTNSQVKVAVVMVRHLSNFTDFDVLERDPRVHLYYTDNVAELLGSDIIILPGSKTTIDDLREMRSNGVAEAILKAHRRGVTVLGICGGYQMMGTEVRDPLHVEGSVERMAGLGLLPMVTTMTSQKTTRQTAFRLSPQATQALGISPQATEQQPSGNLRFPLSGYEIHQGETVPADDGTYVPLNLLDDGRADGCLSSNHCMGTYLHGILDNPAFIDILLRPFANKTGTDNYADTTLSDTTHAAATADPQAFKQQQYDRLAEHVRKYVDMEKLYQILR